jgi:hypothetical protein
MSNETIESYVLSLIDILGQKEELLKLNKLCSKPSINKEEINNIFHNTYGTIKKFRKHMNEAMAWLNKVKDDNKNNFNSNNLEVNSFSDLITSYVSLRDDNDTIQFEGIYFLLFGNGLVFLQMLSEKKPLRGGIDIGCGIKHNNNEIYGNALSKAYYIESEISESIRIVIGKSLYDYINNTASADIESNDLLDYNIYWAKKCLEIIKKDIDKEYIIHYLSKPFQEMEFFEFHYNNTLEFIKSEMNKFKLKNENKKFKKYKKTLSYLQSKE